MWLPWERLSQYTARAGVPNTEWSRECSRCHTLELLQVRLGSRPAETQEVQGHLIPLERSDTYYWH